MGHPLITKTMSKYIRKTKTLFTLGGLLIVLLIGFGIEMFQGTHIVEASDMWRPYNDRFEYARGDGANVLTALTGILQVPAAPAEGATLRNVGGVPVLLYHGIVKVADRFGITEASFKDQMYSLKKAGYRTITPEELDAYLKGSITLPEKAFLLTFDDGRLDSYVKADPILMAVGYHALMFVAVDSSIPQDNAHQTFYINAKDIKKMIDSGRWSIGSHALQLTDGFVTIDEKGTQANFLSSKAWVPKEKRLETDEEYFTRIKNEIDGSRAKLESMFDTKVTVFAYPFGDYGQQSGDLQDATTTIAQLIGNRYAMAFRQVWPKDGEFTLNYQDADRLRLKRFETPTDWTGAQLVAFMTIAHDKNLPFYDDFSKKLGWQATWGSVSYVDGGMNLSANSTATGSGAFLDGAKNWKDYTFNASIDTLHGGYVSLMARYQDNQNYAVCTYGHGRVKIEDLNAGNKVKLIDVKAPTPPSQNGSFGVRVKGTTIECLLNGQAVATAATSIQTGGIGVKIWDERPENAQILVKRVLVTAIQ